VADLTITLTGDEARAVRAIQKVIDKQGELARKAAEVGTTTKKAADDGAMSIEKVARSVQDTVNDLNKWSTATNVLRESWRGVLGVMQAVVDKQRDAQQFVRGSQGLKGLEEMALGDPAKLLKLTAQARRVAGLGIGDGNLNAAADVVKSAVAAGFEDDASIDFFGRVAKTLGGETGKVAEGMAALQGNLGTRETGTIQQLFNKLAFAAKDAPGGIAETAKYSAVGASFARELGISDEQLLAMYAQTAAGAASPEKGGTQLSALMQALLRKGYSGDVLTSVQKISAMGKSPAELFELFGSDEAFRGYSSLLQNIPAVRERERGLLAAQGRDVDLARAGEMDPTIRAMRAGERARMAGHLADEPTARYHEAIDAMLDEDLVEMKRLGFPEFWRTLVDKGIEGPFGISAPSGRTLLKHLAPESWVAPEVERRTGIRPDGSMAPAADPQMSEQTQVLRDIERNSRGVQLVQPPGSGGRDAR
jgi:hypothetical protein